MRLRSWISISRNIKHWSRDYFYYLLDQPLPELAGKGYYIVDEILVEKRTPVRYNTRVEISTRIRISYMELSEYE